MARRGVDLDNLRNIEIMERYRFDRAGIEYLDFHLGPKIQPETRRNNSLSLVEKILITLRYLATGGIQLNDGDIHAVSQPSVSRCVTEVVDAIRHDDFASRHLNFPIEPERLQRINEGFFGIAGMPHVIGLIDGTHIQIQAPSVDEPAYVNRMSYHSINTQIVIDCDDNIIDCVARWPGSAHDSRILRCSGLHQLLEEGRIPGADNFLLGDSGYPCKKWLLTPFMNPQGVHQVDYNRAHKKTRSKVERAIGQLKRRWGIMRGEMRLKPEKACKVITACAVLHNVCKTRNIPIVDGVPPQDGGQNALNNNRQYNGPQNGLQYRLNIANRYF